MTTSYYSELTITDTKIFIRTLAGNQQLIDTVTRGQKENQDLGLIMISHKQQADVLLGTSTTEQLIQRQSFDAKMKGISAPLLS